MTLVMCLRWMTPKRDVTIQQRHKKPSPIRQKLNHTLVIMGQKIKEKVYSQHEKTENCSTTSLYIQDEVLRFCIDYWIPSHKRMWIHCPVGMISRLLSENCMSFLISGSCVKILADRTSWRSQKEECIYNLQLALRINPNGIRNAPITLQRLIQKVISAFEVQEQLNPPR